MVFDYLSNFEKRMKKVGYYSLLFRNSIMKGNWKKYGFFNYDEEENFIFTILLFIMEQSLKEEVCTIDSITEFVDEINHLYYKKSLSYEEEKSLVDFVINSILCNDGEVRYYNGFDYAEGKEVSFNITYLNTKIIEVDEVRRVSYSLTDEGYNMILGTLEIEENLRISIHEMIFKMHLDRAEYNKAVDDIKNIFNSFRIRVQKMEEDIQRIKENPLSYSNADYEEITKGNLELMKKSKEKYKYHREVVEERIAGFVDRDINIQELNKEEKDNLRSLEIIKLYLNKTIDEDQRILKKHFQLKEIYTQELEDISKMALIKRFNLNKEVYEKIIRDIDNIKDIEVFLRPLFLQPPEKRYNINKSIIPQNPIKNKVDEGNIQLEKLDFTDYKDEMERQKREKLKKYKTVINEILEITKRDGKVYLSTLNEILQNDNELKGKLIPTVEIFREVIIEFLQTSKINIEEIRKELKNSTDTGELEFQLAKSILEVIEENNALADVKVINIEKALDREDLVIKNVPNELGETKSFICSDVYFIVK